MSVVNLSNFLVELNKKISNTTNDKELLILVKALEKLKTGVIFTIGTFANLPDPTENIGKLYFVEADSLLYFSFIAYNTSIAQWIPITNVSANVLWTWGENGSGGLGNGNAVSRCSPGTVAGNDVKWCQISNGSAHMAAIKSDGTLWTWGYNGSGRLGTNSAILFRCSPGTVAGGGTNWCYIRSALFGNNAIKTDGTLWTWGANFTGSLGDGTVASRSSPGTVAGGGTNWCQVSNGGNNSGQTAIAVKTDGTLWTWGCNSLGQLGDGTTVSRCSPGTVAGGGTNWCIASISCGHAAAIKTDGTLWTWGSNGSGALGDGTTVSRCSPGTVAGGGTTWCLIDNSFLTTNNIALKTDGTLWTWGINGGLLGDGTTVSRCSPGTVAGGGTTWCEASVGYGAMAVKTDGTLWTWGRNDQGLLGDGTAVARCSPGTVVGGGTTWVKACNSVGSSIAITKETL